MIVGVTGYAQNGKDTVGGEFTNAWEYTRYGFADQLKSMALRLNPQLLHVFEPETPIPSGWYRIGATQHYYSTLASLVERQGWEVAKSYREVRQFLIELGMQVRLIIGQDSWVHALANSIAYSPDPADMRAVITDVRFPNEARWVTKNGGVIIRVTKLDKAGKPVTVVDPTLESERYVPLLHAHYDVRAEDGDMAGLLAQVRGIAADLDEGFKPKVASTYEGRFGDLVSTYGEAH